MSTALLSIWCVGMLGRGFWTPDEPREADLSWRMSWQTDRAVPLLAGEPFCEKPPLTYWVAGDVIALLGPSAWATRLPNLLYALLTALGVGLLARRSAGPLAGLIAAGAIGTFLLAYQTLIWLATDAPLLAAVSLALLGLHQGYYARDSGGRLRGYTLMHAALALGFLCKSAAAWMVPALTLVTLAIWDRRWRELLRWELYAGLCIQAAVILTWVWFVFTGPDGIGHLKVFFWNNLVGRFTRIDAPQALQYASGHRNSPGKYFIELPMYLFPWTLLVAAALRRAWRQRRASPDEARPVRFALASAVPAIIVLSLAATARNVYLAPALPGFALLLGWWGRAITSDADRWDLRALAGTALMLRLAVIVFAAVLAAVGLEAWQRMSGHGAFVAISGIGLAASAGLALYAGLCARRGRLLRAQAALLFAYCALLSGPASQLYRRVDVWQDLAIIGGAVSADAADRPLILFSADETTRAFIDMYARPSVELIAGPPDGASIEHLRRRALAEPRARVLAQLPGRALTAEAAALAHLIGRRVDEAENTSLPAWIDAAGLRPARIYSLPNGRRYALLEPAL